MLLTSKQAIIPIQVQIPQKENLHYSILPMQRQIVIIKVTTAALMRFSGTVLKQKEEHFRWV
jgi:hypothetical protein